MRKSLSKFTALFLSAIFTFNMLSVSVFAANDLSPEANEAISFIKSKNFPVGEVVSVTNKDNSIVFTVKYLSSGEVSYIEYSENSDSDVFLTLTEGDKINHIVFKNNGSVLYEGVETDVFEQKNVTRIYNSRAAYASYMCTADQLPGTCDRVFEQSAGTVNPITLALPGVVQSLTVSTLSAVICSGLGWVNAESVAAMIAGAILDRAINITSILYTAKVTRDNNQYPLQIFYKYDETWSWDGGSWPYKNYKVENLL